MQRGGRFEERCGTARLRQLTTRTDTVGKRKGNNAQNGRQTERDNKARTLFVSVVVLVVLEQLAVELGLVQDGERRRVLPTCAGQKAWTDQQRGEVNGASSVRPEERSTRDGCKECVDAAWQRTRDLGKQAQPTASPDQGARRTRALTRPDDHETQRLACFLRLLQQIHLTQQPRRAQRKETCQHRCAGTNPGRANCGSTRERARRADALRSQIRQATSESGRTTCSACGAMTSSRNGGLPS